MPSIPQSLLWISLVVLWLFVLVPMLVSRRDAVRRTSDVALATRLLTSGTTARLLKRGGPAAGHRSDPDWRPDHDEPENFDEQPQPTGSVVLAAAGAEQAGADYLDVDVVEEGSGALPAAASDDDDSAEEGLAEEYQTEPVDDEDGCSTAVSEDTNDEEAGEYEYVADTSGLEAEDTEDDRPGDPPRVAAPSAARRRHNEARAAAAAIARKYRFRKRVLMAMALVLVCSAATAFTMTATAWWLCGGAAGLTLLYLGYLRRQTRIEEQVRARRRRRMARGRYLPEDAREPGYEVVPSRLRRPGVAVLDIDDEDPVFEHLDHVAFAREHDWRHDLPRAAGQ